MRPIAFTVHFCPELTHLLGAEEIRVKADKSFPFHYLFQSLLSQFPQIEKIYPPWSGKLAFSINKSPPELETRLRDGDDIYFWIIGAGTLN